MFCLARPTSFPGSPIWERGWARETKKISESPRAPFHAKRARESNDTVSSREIVIVIPWIIKRSMVKYVDICERIPVGLFTFNIDLYGLLCSQALFFCVF